MSMTFEQTIQRAYQLAGGLRHELVTLEHLLAGLLENPTIQRLISKTGGDLDSLIKAASGWLNDDTNHVVVKGDAFQPRHTSLVVNVIKKAKTQSMFSGRKEAGPIDIYLALYGIPDSPASWFLEKYAAPKDQVSAYLNDKDDADGEIGMPPEAALEILEQYCINLNEKALSGKIDPLIGREREVEQITQIMARRNKHNVIMTGDPGVGKTIIVEGLAKRISEKDVPEPLLDHTIWNLDIATLVAGTKFRGDFEERMKQIIQAFSSLPTAIMFIDEIHMIMGAGSGGGSAGSIDAANMLKPALSRGELRCIGSTTQEEYRKHFEKDRALVRRFQKLDVFEPSPDDAKRILRGIAPRYEEYHGLSFDGSALDAAVDLTVAHMHDRFLPDKAIDIIDSAAAWQRIKPKESRLRVITKAEVEAEVSRVAKVPAATVKSNEADKLARLDTELRRAVFGQDAAVEGLVNAIYMSRSGLREGDKTVGSFLFSGPSGVGKTEVAKQLANILGIHFVRFDMSEYQERHSVSKFIGSPPGYVGYGDGSAGSGLLVNELETHPHCVLLFDEIEKAHQDVYNIFLQLMDRGMVTSSNGKSVSARNAIVIFTSNLGAAEMEKESIGFGAAATERDEDTQAINRFFTPEFRNRLDAILRFNRLTRENMESIVDKFMSQLNGLGAGKKVRVVCDSSAREWLINKGFDRNMGARPLARVIADSIKKPLSREILFGRLRNGGAAMVKAGPDGLEFEYMSNPEPREDDDILALLPVDHGVEA
jgi:ATP-dependent Clp protease ATP-binding subunit ClpA